MVRWICGPTLFWGVGPNYCLSGLGGVQAEIVSWDPIGKVLHFFDDGVQEVEADEKVWIVSAFNDAIALMDWVEARGSDHVRGRPKHRTLHSAGVDFSLFRCLTGERGDMVKQQL